MTFPFSQTGSYAMQPFQKSQKMFFSVISRVLGVSFSATVLTIASFISLVGQENLDASRLINNRRCSIS